MAKSAILAIDRHISYEIRVAVDRWGSGMLRATVSLGAIMLLVVELMMSGCDVWTRSVGSEGC